MMVALVEGKLSHGGALSPAKRSQLGSRIRLRREELGLKQMTAAQRIGRSVHWLSDLENGKLDPKLSDLAELADVLKRDIGWLLGESPDDRKRHSSVAQPRNLDSEEYDTERREFLLLLAAMGIPLDVAKVVRLTRQPQAMDVAYLADMERVTDALMASWYTTSPVSLLPAVSGHLSMLRALLPGPARLRSALASATGRAALLMAHALLKLDMRSDATAQLLLADALAREAGNPRLHSLVLAIQSGLYSTVSLGGRGDDTRMALALLDEAATGLDPHAHGLLRVIVLARRAEERAVIGDSHGALQDLDAAEKSLVPAEGESFFGPRDTAELGAVRGSIQGLLDEHRAAVQTLDVTLADMHPSLVAWRAAVLADQAASLAQQAEVDAACAKLHLALDLAHQSAAADHVRRAYRVRRLHLRAWTGAPAVRQLDERLGNLS